MASVEDLERRVEQLEEQVRHTLPPSGAAVGYGLGLVHEDVRTIKQVQEQHGQMLQEILRRLPA